MLINHLKAINTPKNGHVFVPLCGKSVDMLWFAKQGLDVIGIELSEIAVTQFFAENDLQATVSLHPSTSSLTCYQTEPPRDCRRPNFLREYDNEKTNLHS